MSDRAENDVDVCCPECGADDLAAGDQKANGTEYRCLDCDHLFMADATNDEWDGDEDRE